MGKNLTQQKRGKGSPRYKSVSFRSVGDVKLLNKGKATVIDIVPSSYHTAPLAILEYETGEAALTVATEGLTVGSTITIGGNAALKHGNALKLDDIPAGG